VLFGLFLQIYFEEMLVKALLANVDVFAGFAFKTRTADGLTAANIAF
jgi:hypothetical protein